MRTVWGIIAALSVLAAAGCGPKGPADARELAAALKGHGVAYTVTETAALSNLRTDGLRLTGDGLVVDVYRIESEEDLKLAAAVALLAGRAQAERGDATPLASHVKGPFLVIVREEPVTGMVAAALEAIFPE